MSGPRSSGDVSSRGVTPTLLVPRSLVLMVLLAACTSGEQAPPSAGPSETPAETPAETPGGEGLVRTDPGATAFDPGRFIYQFNSITAQVSFDGNLAAMNVRNASGVPLGPPSLTVIATDHRRYEGVADVAEPVADGAQLDVRFTFDEAVDPTTIGLAVLSFGSDNVGAMAPVPVGGG
jgi:hypothetical protein